MSKSAIIQLQGKQFLVTPGQVITVDRLDQAEGKTVDVTDVLMVKDKEAVVGTPLVAKAKVTLKVVSHQQGDKVKVFKYKSKSRYRKTQGHRQAQTNLEVVAIA